MRTLSIAVAAAVIAAVVAASAAATGPWDPLRSDGPQHMTIHILSGTAGHEAVLDPNIAVVPGVPVVLTIINASRELHSFTIPKLHINAVISAGRPLHPVVTTIRFTVPSVGTYRWHCDFCPAVHHEGPMGGMLYALVGS
jgi:heme/copper-type cytochrome/quinol oxidase subunit 2